MAPEVIVSGVDEESVTAASGRELVAALARAKAEAVAALPRAAGALVVGCDSVFEIGGAMHGKPASPTRAAERWRAMRGREGCLLTGHVVIDTATGASACGVATTRVRFATPTDREIDAYVATGEPMAVAGGFTLDGRAGVFVAGVDGDPSNVIGLSLPLFRALLGEVGTEVTDLWQ